MAKYLPPNKHSMGFYHRLILLGFFALTSVFSQVQADVVKPALIEISAKKGGEVSIEIRASIEALLTGINSQYKNTQDAPQADAYDALRVLPADPLTREFNAFSARFLDSIRLQADGKTIPLHITQVDIPPPGYVKVPRISLILLAGQLDTTAKQLQWYYPAAFGDNAVRVRQVDTVNEKWHWSDWQWLRNDKTSQPFSLTEVFRQQSTLEVIASYVELGFVHIIPKGLDHILFILGIFLFSTRLKPLLWQVTMFTVAHTITLGLSMEGWISLPAQVVEPLIALSIAYVGIENIFAKNLYNSRLLLVFAFGLLHGMGFASMLADFGMPEHAFITALLSFNVGVELGQLAVITLAFLGMAVWFRHRPHYRQWVLIPGSLLISATGLYWTLQRLLII